MLCFNTIFEDKLVDLIAIDKESNPYPWSEKNLIDSYHHYQNLGAFVDETLVAFILYRTIADEAEIIHLVCDNNSQGKGYAYQLFTELIEQNKENDIARWHLEVRASNAKAIRLYQRLGFIEVGRRKAYYQHEDAILMQLAIGVA